MRLLFIVLTILLVVGLLWFLVDNFGTQIDEVIVLGTPYPDVHIFWVVLGAVAAGIVFAAVIAVAEGAKIRLDNRKLTREIRKLETELNYLRTQPSKTTVSESSARRPESRPALPPPDTPPSAPVYDREDETGSPDPDDDMYTGGRAV